MAIRTRHLARAAALSGTAALCLLAAAAPAAAITNPDISVIGQPFVRLTTDQEDPDHDRLTLDPGEVELVFEAALNPYANGSLTLAAGEEGVDVEEAFFTLVRGLPGEVALKGGKYRVGFGRLNPVHPHAYAFSERPRVLASYLPGEESFNETGVSIYRRFPIAGDFSIQASADWLQGDSFRGPVEPPGDEPPADPLRDETRPAFLGRLSGFSMLGEQSALEFGFSGAGGTVNVAESARAILLGADTKAKLWTSESAYLVLQGEALHRREDVVDVLSPEGGREIERSGGYVLADYNWARRYNGGGWFEIYEEPVDGSSSVSYGLFAGLSLLEETTVFRLDWNRFTPDQGHSFDTVTLRVIFSMGPHKAHQF